MTEKLGTASESGLIGEHDVVRGEDLIREVYGRSLSTHVVRGLALHDAMGSIFNRENIVGNRQMLDTWMFWRNHLNKCVEEEADRDGALLQVARSMGILLSIARDMPEELVQAEIDAFNEGED